MEAIKIEVTGNIARVIEKPAKITSGTVGLPVEFTFDSQWEGLSKIAVFKAGHISRDMPVVDGATAVPIEVLAKPNVRLNIGVYGVNEAGSIAIPTIWENAGKIYAGAVPDGNIGTDFGVAQKQYDEAVLAAEKANASAKKAESDASVAENAADRADAFARSAAASAALAGEEAEYAIIECTQQKNAAINAKHDAEADAARAEAAAEYAEEAAESIGSTVCVSYSEPADANAKVWANPTGAVGSVKAKEEASDVSGIVGLALNEMLNNTAARYATITDALAGASATANGKVLAYTCVGVLNIMLLDDISAASVINITKECTLHLNGKKLSLGAGAYLNITTTGKVTINGTVAGSEITKNVSSANEKMVAATGTTLHLIGGTYSAYGTYTTAIVPIRAESATTNITMDGCTVNIDASATTVLYGAQFRGETVVGNCTFNVNNRGGQCAAINTVSGNIASLILRNSTITVSASTLTATGILSYASDKTIIENCDISAVAPTKQMSAFGLQLHKGTGTVTNCHIKADGWSDTYNDAGEMTIYSVYAIAAYANASININGGYYWGARDAVGIHGTARINGGVYDGCQHGGAYMSGSDIKAKNATFRCVEYAGVVGWENNFHGGAIYCGSGDNADVNVYFDNCRFESNTATSHGIVAKYNGTEVFLSNCVIDGDFSNDLRADAGNTIYIGKNVVYETVSASGGTIDTTTYAAQEFGFETEAPIPNALLSVKDDRGNWVAIV